jgi:hypothetical protein
MPDIVVGANLFNTADQVDIGTDARGYNTAKAAPFNNDSVGFGFTHDAAFFAG